MLGVLWEYLEEVSECVDDCFQRSYWPDSL